MIAVAPVSGHASSDIDALLAQADSLRSSDPAGFARALKDANAAAGLATPAQQELLAYLNAYALGYAGRYDEAIASASRLLASGDVNMRFRAGAFIVNSYAVTLRFTEGLRQLQQTLALIEQIKDPDIRQHGLFVAAVLYNQIGQYQLGLHYADTLLAEATLPGRTRCFAGQVRVEALQGLDQLPAQDAALQNVIDQCTAQGELLIANFTRTTLARKWSAQGKRDQAVALLQHYQAEVNASKYPRLMGEVNSLLGELLLARGDVIQAERHARAAIEQISGIGFSLPLVTAHRVLYEVSQTRDDPAASLVNYRNYAEADKAYLNDVKQREVAYQIVRQETELKSQQIELLDRQNQVLQLQQAVDKQSTQNSRLFAALLGVLALTIGYWAYKIKRVQNSLRRSAETDALTGVFNRRHFAQMSERTIALCAKNAEPVAMLMFDLDYFKSINDRFGHSAGDWVLKRVADVCQPFCRRIDHFGRLGGEEFAILLHGCDLKHATRLAEDCRVRISLIDTRVSGETFRVTASFGVASNASAGYSLEKLMSQSDQALYQAKRDNRNCVRGYKPAADLVVARPAERNDTPLINAIVASDLAG